MCGIAGYWSKNKLIDKCMLSKMGDAISHRGPDHQGIHLNDKFNFGMVNQRLSIIDINPRSHQPFHTKNKKYSIVFNGEIYNYKNLREELIGLGYKFETECDTEVILYLFEEFGIGSLNRLNGMFAFSIFDNEKGEIFIARDRLGIKPLYYYLHEGVFAYTSDLNAFSVNSFIEKTINRDSISQFLFFDYIPQPNSIYNNVMKLLPGHYLILDKSFRIKMKKYWDIDLSKYILDHSDIVNQFLELFHDSVSIRINADVKVGAFLSGGLDSSAVISGMKGEFSTYTIGFDYATNDLDVKRSKLMTEKFSLNNILTLIGEKELKNFTKYLSILDEPISESSMVSLLANFKRIKEDNVKVILTGDGADELLGGYKHFFKLLQFYNIPKYKNRLHRFCYTIISSLLSGINSRNKIGKYRDLIIKRNIELINSNSISQAHQIMFSARNANSLKKILGDNFRLELDNYSKYLYIDNELSLKNILFNETKTSLVNRHLSKIDKVSMANSIEARVPFLDHRLVEFVYKIPDHYKCEKKILKLAMKNILPNKIITDKKRGFSLPIQNWTHNIILKKIEEFIIFDNLIDVGLIKSNNVDKIIIETKNQRIDHSRTIWNFFVLSQWLEKN